MMFYISRFVIFHEHSDVAFPLFRLNSRGSNIEYFGLTDRDQYIFAFRPVDPDMFFDPYIDDAEFENIKQNYVIGSEMPFILLSHRYCGPMYPPQVLEAALNFDYISFSLYSVSKTLARDKRVLIELIRKTPKSNDNSWVGRQIAVSERRTLSTDRFHATIESDRSVLKNMI